MTSLRSNSVCNLIVNAKKHLFAIDLSKAAGAGASAFLDDAGATRLF